MEGRKVYHVNPSKGGWRAEPENSDRAVCQGQRKPDVIDCIKEKARKERLSQVIVHDREGKIVTEWTYGDLKNL